ncbi:multidrug effflux MFS transporter [Roseospirillum parvum]
MTGLVAFGAVSTDLYLPSLPAMTREFGVDVSLVQLTLSVFTFGFAAGMLVLGPMSDRFGRRPVLIGGVAIYVLASLGCLLAPSVEALIGARFVQALGAAAGPVIGRAIVRDVYTRVEAARMLSYMASAMALAPAVAPLIGGWLHETFGWQANFAALALFGALILLGTLGLLRETNDSRDPRALKARRLVGTYRMLLTDRRFVGHTVVLTAMFGGLFSFISGSSFVVIDVLGVAPGQFGLAFACVAGSYAAGAYMSGRVGHRLGLERAILLGALAGALIAGGGAGLAWAGIETVPAVIAPVAGFFFCCAFVLPNGTAGAINPFPHNAGSASALLGFLQMGGGALVGYGVGALHDGTTRVMLTSIALCAITALIAHLTLVRPDE